MSVRKHDDQVSELCSDLRASLTALESKITVELLEAEERGAAEQRRRDAPKADWLCRQLNAKNDAESAVVCYRTHVAALEERLQGLVAAFEPLLAACEAEMTGDSTKDCGDEEAVASGVTEDGYPTESPITFGMLRRARAVLTPEVKS